MESHVRTAKQPRAIKTRDRILLEPGESTVGVVISVEHTAATPLGAQVVCRARVIYADGPLISFQLEAHDEHEKIAIGTHKLRVIEAARLAKRVQTKTR
jgi:predicted thioesterase